MDLLQHVTQIKEGLRTGAFVNEASISQGVVLRLLQALNWPTFNTQVVSPEYSLAGRRVDFALCNAQSRPIIFIEVKQQSTTEGADRQLFEYAFHTGIPLAILTNGREWHFYLPGEQGEYQDRRVYMLDLLERNTDECVMRLKRYLEYSDSCTGVAIRNAREDYQNVARERFVEQTLPAAWGKLIEEQDELLLELVADKVESLCGFKPSPDAVANFLRTSVIAGSQVVTRSARRIASIPPEINSDNLQTLVNRTPQTDGQIGFKLNGKVYTANSAREVMTRIFCILAEKDPTFLNRFAARPQGRSRNYISRNILELYPGRPDLCETHSIKLVEGWWMGTNHSKETIKRIITMACEVAGIQEGNELTVNLGR